MLNDTVSLLTGGAMSWALSLLAESAAPLAKLPVKALAQEPEHAATDSFTTTLDIAAAISAILWPMIVLIVLLAYRDKIPSLVQGLASRITKFEIAGVSLELAKATAFAPDWRAGFADLRQKAAAIYVNDSTAMTFATQLREGGSADYAEVNLGHGTEWLASRLFIMAIVFARVKGIRCLVFTDAGENARRRYVGWAEPEKTRWALAKRYSWFESAYALAYSTTLSGQVFVVNTQGRLGRQSSQQDVGPNLDLLRNFLQGVQGPPPQDQKDWVLIDSDTGTYEHTHWVTAATLEEVLGNDLNRSSVSADRLKSKNDSEQLRMILSEPAEFVAVIADNQRLDYLLDRNALLEQFAAKAPPEPNSGN